MLALSMALVTVFAIALHTRLQVIDAEKRLADARMRLYTLTEWCFLNAPNTDSRDDLRRQFPELFFPPGRRHATDGSVESRT